MQMKQRDGTQWRNLYPKTLAENVSLNSGETVQEKIENIENKFPENIILWEGEAYPTANQTIEPSKPLKDCLNGWEIRFQSYVRGEGTEARQFQYMYVRKTHALYSDGRSVRFVLSQQGGIFIQKFVYIHNDKIVGHDFNREDDNDRLAITGIFEW